MSRRKLLGAWFMFCAIIVSAHAGKASAAVLISDDFNRPDSAVVGNGWTTAPGSGGTLSILNNHLTNAEPQYSAVNYPLLSTGAITISADASGANGYGGLPYRYGAVFYIKSDGTIDNGYGISLGRADANYPSHVMLMQNGVTVGDLLSTFQFTDVTHIDATFNADGSVVGVVSDPNNPANVYNFSFPARVVSNTGTYFQIDSNPFDMRTGTPTYSWVDNVVVSDESSSQTPADLAQALVDSVTAANLPHNIEDSYLANLKKVSDFITEGKTQAAINQLNAFINKLGQDLTHGLITRATHDDLANKARAIIDALQ